MNQTEQTMENAHAVW